MSGLQSSGNRRRRITSCVHHVSSVVVLRLVQKRLNAGLDEAPGTGVQGFFLTPHNGLGVLVGVQVLLQQCPWERIKLLDTGNGSVLDAFVGTMFVKRGIHLTRTQDDTVDLIGVVNGLAMFSLRNDPLEVRISDKVVNVGTGQRVTQQRFREEDNKSCDNVS